MRHGENFTTGRDVIETAAVGKRRTLRVNSMPLKERRDPPNRCGVTALNRRQRLKEQADG